jgi:hypothetical protein
MIKNILIIFLAYKVFQNMKAQAPAAPAAQIPEQPQSDVQQQIVAQGKQIFKDNVIPFVKGEASKYF